MTRLGFIYETGEGVTEDDSVAAAWHSKAADAGNAAAMNRLGFMYQNGKGVAKDEAEAVLWYRKAGDAGYAPALNKLGFMYENGTSVTKDDTEALVWYRKAAAEGGNVSSMNQARLNEAHLHVRERKRGDEGRSGVAGLVSEGRRVQISPEIGSPRK